MTTGYFIQENRAEEFFRTARERYQIYLRRTAGEAPPWTEDSVLQSWRFCNVFREDDRVTRWIAQNLREPLRKDPSVLRAMAAARWFNRPETLAQIKPMLLAGEWSTAEVVEKLRSQKPVVGAAYLIKTPNGMSKLDGVCWIIDQLDAVELTTRVTPGEESLESFWSKLRQYPFFGPFMAYEVVSDLRHTWMLDRAPDINTWASAGPGCAKGLSFLMGDRLDIFSYTTRQGQKAMLLLMREMLGMSREQQYWPEEWPTWEMREVEHWLCEYAKWVTGTYLRQNLKRRFKS